MGFKREVDDLWPRLERALKDNNSLPSTKECISGLMSLPSGRRSRLASDTTLAGWSKVVIRLQSKVQTLINHLIRAMPLMLERKLLFPNVIELNFQAGHVIGCNVYLVFDADEWILIDVGYEESVEELIELIRELDFPLSKCKTLVATHADVDHGQGLAAAKQVLKTTVSAHPRAAKLLAAGDKLRTFAEIEAQNINLDMPIVETENIVDEGSVIEVGKLKLEVWSTPGHADSQLAFRMGNLLFSGDNIFRDGCVGAIDAHHGSDIAAFIRSLQRIRASDVEWLLPSHGPTFRKDNALIDKTIARLQGYLHMADFGTCAIDWPLMDQWEEEIAQGKMPQ